MILWIGSLVCIAVVLCALVFATLRRRRSVAVCGFVVIGLSAAIVGGGITAPASDTGARPVDTGRPASRTAQRAPQAQATPASTPAAAQTDPAVLETFARSWTGVVRVSVAAIRAHDSAGEFLSNGHVAAGAGALKQCQDVASGIARESANLRLGSGHQSDLELLAAITKMGDGLRLGCKSARAFLDSDNPADFADSHAHFAHVADDVFRAESLARATYQRLGGNPDSLSSFKTALR